MLPSEDDSRSVRVSWVIRPAAPGPTTLENFAARRSPHSSASHSASAGGHGDHAVPRDVVLGAGEQPAGGGGQAGRVVHVQRAVVDVPDLVPGDDELVRVRGPVLDHDDVVLVPGEGDPGHVQAGREGDELQPDRAVEPRAERGAQRVQERLRAGRRGEGADGVAHEPVEEAPRGPEVLRQRRRPRVRRRFRGPGARFRHARRPPPARRR